MVEKRSAQSVNNGEAMMELSSSDEDQTTALEEKQFDSSNTEPILPIKKRCKNDEPNAQHSSYQLQVDQCETSASNSSKENASVSSNKLPAYKVIYHQASHENIPNKKKENVPGPGSRATPREAFCLSKKLTSSEVVEENPKLYFDAYDASILTEFPEIVESPPASFQKPKELLIFDGNDKRYTMMLSQHINEGNISYSLNTGWNRFVRTHNLKEGDELTFYKFRDKSVSKGYYYVLKYFRKPKDKKESSDDGQKELIGRHKLEDNVGEITQKSSILRSKKDKWCNYKRIGDRPGAS